MKKVIILFVLLFILCGCVNRIVPPANESQETLPETLYESIETEVPEEHNYTYSGNLFPAVSGDKQYLSTAPTDSAVKGSIVYAVNNQNAGRIVGDSVQNLGEPSDSVTAVANLGYKFIEWSDGKTDPVRSGDTEEGIYTAIFDYEILDMPIISVTTENNAPIQSQEVYLKSTISIIGCSEEYELDEVTAEIRGRGNASWGHPKKSYKFKLQKKENLFGLARGKERIWVLIANYSDTTLLRNHISLELARTMDGIAWEPSSLPVELYINGEYRGVYLLAEEIKISGDRVDITDTMPDEIDNGYLFELSDYARKPEAIAATARGYNIHNEFSSNPEIEAAQREYIKNYINASYKALLSGDFDAASEYIDVDSLVAAYLVEEIVKNVDNQYDSFYMYKDRGSKMHFGPLWDFDHSIGYKASKGELYEGIYVGNGEGSSGRISDWLPCALRSKWFREMVREEWNEIYDQLITLPDYIRQVAEDGIRSYNRNFERWSQLEINEKEYENQYLYISDWLEKRIEWLDMTFNSDGFVEEGEGLRYSSVYKHLIPPPPEDDE